jgi:hypothetical protein
VSENAPRSDEWHARARTVSPPNAEINAGKAALVAMKDDLFFFSRSDLDVYETRRSVPVRLRFDY